MKPAAPVTNIGLIRHIFLWEASLHVPVRGLFTRVAEGAAIPRFRLLGPISGFCDLSRQGCAS